MKNSPLSTSLRSATQATDSTCKRMDGKQGRREGAGPEIAGHLPQDQKEENDAGGVQQDIGQVVSAGVIQSVELAIQHVGEPSERVPVGGMKVRKGPDDSLGSETACDLRIIIDIDLIVGVDELVPDRLAEDEGHGQQKERADGRNGVAAEGGRGQSHVRRTKIGTVGRASRSFCGRLRLLSAGFFFPFRLIWPLPLSSRRFPFRLRSDTLRGS